MTTIRRRALLAPTRPSGHGQEGIRRSTVDLSLYFFGVSLKLERGRIAIEDNG
jgi:hypothetical protein